MEKSLETSEVNDVNPVIAKSPKIRRIIGGGRSDVSVFAIGGVVWLYETFFVRI